MLISSDRCHVLSGSKPSETFVISGPPAVGQRPNFNQLLHKLRHRLAKLSAVPILMSSQRQDEMQWEERAGKTGRSNVGNCGFGFDLRRRFCLRLWCKGVAFAQAIGKISSLFALYSGGNGGGTK